MNDDGWIALSFELVKMSWASRNEEVAQEKLKNGLSRQISELADIRSGS